MHRLRMAILLALVSLFAGLISSRPIFYQISYLFIFLILAALFWAWTGISWVHLQRQTRSRRAQVGRPLEERFAVYNNSIFPKLWLEVRDESTLPGHLASRVVNALGSHERRSWTTRTTCRERGRYTLGPLTLYSGDPLGFFRFSHRLEPTSSIVVYPATVDIRSFPSPVGILPGGDALRRRTHYITTNAAGVRDYVPGDSFNRIHWRSTARRDQLIVKEFELDPLADVWLFLDMSSDVQASLPREDLTDLDEAPFWARPKMIPLPPSTEEYGVTIAASLAQHFLRRDRALGLASHGQRREVIQADRGERQLTKMLETLAVLRAQGDIPFDELLSAQCQSLVRGTTVITITPSTSLQWVVTIRQMERAGLRVVAVVIDAASFGGEEGSEALINQLNTMGLTAILIKRGDSLEEALSR